MVRIEDVTDDNNGEGQGVELRRRNQQNAGRENGEHQEPAQQEGGEVAPAERELTFDEEVNRHREEYQPTPMEKVMAIVKSLLMRALVVYFVMYFLRSNTPSKPTGTTTDGSGKVQAPASLASSNMFPNGTEFDMYVYVSEDNHSIRNFTNAKLIWKQEGLIYGDWYGGPNSDGTYSHTVDVPVSKKVQNNGSIYLHTFLVPFGYSPDPSEKHLYSKPKTVHGIKMLNKFKKKRYAKTHNLLTGETTASLEDQEKAKKMSSEVVSHWHPNMTINLVTDWTAWTMGSVPPPLNEYIKFIPNELKYQPVLFYNEYWNLMKDYNPINSSTPTLPVTITFQPLSLFKWQIYAAQSMRNQWSANLLAGQDDDEDDQDALKEAILDTNPYLLGLTFAVSILHSIFEFLAFKNDIQFWNNRKSLEGLSVRSVFFNVFQSLIVLLYVMDNETNFVIRVSVFAGLLIEIWKINKVMDIKLDRENLILGLIPRVKLSDKGSYVESSTRQYDILAFKYLSWALFPLIVGYAVYSLLYLEHKGWYSWVLSMLYGFLLTFGFIMMTPQLFINYKLKSVAHLPWRMLSYKFLNTFIDDIFAFVIKMPTMYRIGCLRDDVIFFIYLYQRYIYRIDPTRVNEFGYSAEMLDGDGKEKNEAQGTVPSITEGSNEDATKAKQEPKVSTGSPTKTSAKEPTSSEPKTGSPNKSSANTKSKQRKSKKKDQ